MKTLTNSKNLSFLIDDVKHDDFQNEAFNMLHMFDGLQHNDAAMNFNLAGLQSSVANAVTTVKPVYSLAQIVTQLTTSWGGGDTSTHLWAASPTQPTTPKAVITFGINTSAPTNFTVYGAPASPESSGLVTMTATQVATARLSFNLWDSLISSTLVESGGAGANITLNYSSATNGGTYSKAIYYATQPSKDIVADQIWLASTWGTNGDSGMAKGGYGFNTMIHEIGHSLGLTHPGLYNGTGSYAANAAFSQDNRQYTTMSYFGGYDTATNAWTQDGTYISYKYSQTPMVYDIAAIQSLYGADKTTRTGDTVYGYNNNFAVNDIQKSIFDFSVNTIPLCTIYDAGGNNDALDCSGWNGNQIIDLTPGNYSSVRGLNNNVGIAFNTVIEKAIGGAGNDKLIGNTANNVLNGGAGADSMFGGAGNDTYYVDNARDLVTESVNAGVDTVYASIGFTLGLNVENLILTGSAAINGTGNDLNNALTGNAAANILNGLAGADNMSGGAGNDVYYVDNAGDMVIENVNAGLDTVYASVSHSLSNNVENLILTGTVSISGAGNALDNTLIGNAATNALNGGAGADILIGGLGKDYLLLQETIAVTDTIKVAAGDSLVTGFDIASGFKLGVAGISPTAAGVDRLDLASISIAANASHINGKDFGNIGGHSINNGLISFENVIGSAPLAINAANLANAISYLQAAITGNNTVDFIVDNNTFIFQDGGAVDTLVELLGVTATGLSTTGAHSGAVWIV